MCGIVGLLRWDGLAPGDAERVTRGAHALRHRGPDGDGFWSDEHCALGFRRLKVIDLSPAGDQPMANETGSLHVVFNGEIYNFRDLRSQLEALGHAFRSQSDTEVLLHGYEEWGGEALLGKLRGMFAFALWDAPNRRLFLARDPLGVKPLYLAERNGCILFASEPKALFATGLVEAKLDPAALHEALTYRYVPAPRSGFRDVEKLPAGNLAIAEKGELRYRAWWRIGSERECDIAAGDLSDLVLEQHEEEFREGCHVDEIIEYAIPIVTQRRLVSDVPLGAWLSGGIDSGLVLSMMGEGIHTFSAGFANPEWDERDLAHATARHLKATHRDFEVPADLFKLLPQIVWHADEPYFDSSCLPTYVLAEKTKPHATVVLSGDGGDESFGGYERYVGIAQFYKKWKKLPGWFQRLQLRYAKWRHPAPSRSGWDRLVRWLDKCAQQEAAGFHPYLGAVTLFDQDQIRALYADDLLEVNQELDGREYVALALRKATKERYPDCPPDEHKLDTGLLQRGDLATYLPGDVLHKVDRMSMAHGLEVRSPFLDVDLVNLALSISDDVRLPARETKPLLRRLAEQRLPAEVVHARKRGFGVPLDDWFRGPLKTLAADLFESSHLVTDHVFKPKYWEPFWKEHQESRANHGERLYALLALELWHRTFLSGSPATERPAPL